MKTTTMGLALALGLAGGLGAGTLLRDWRGLAVGKDVGTWADPAGSHVALSEAAGPGPKQRALAIDSQVVQWGGAWATPALTSLAGGSALRFKARSDAPLILSVMLTDDAKVQVEHRVRLEGGAWESFELPLSAFHKSQWQDPAAAKDGVFQPQRLAALDFSPIGQGPSRVLVGPLTLVKGPAVLKDGGMAPGLVQDFVALEPGAYGSFADANGSRLSMDIRRGAPHRKGLAALLDYDQKVDGWCGEWIRAGQDWKGQDWGGAKAVRVEAYCAEPVVLQFAFNDANQNAYVADGDTLAAKRWTSLRIPLRSFVLNPDYQPPKAKKGAALDLSRVVTFNLAPRTPGRHQVWIGQVSLER